MSAPNPNPTQNQPADPKKGEIIDFSPELVDTIPGSEGELQVTIEDVVGKSIIINRIEELPSKYDNSTYIRVHAEEENTGRLVSFPIPRKRGEGLALSLKALKPLLDQGKRIRTRILRARYYDYYHYVLAAPEYPKLRKRQAQRPTGGGRKFSISTNGE